MFTKMMNFHANPRCGDVFQKLLKKVFIILMILRALQGKNIFTIFNTVIKFRVSVRRPIFLKVSVAKFPREGYRIRWILPQNVKIQRNFSYLLNM